MGASEADSTESDDPGVGPERAPTVAAPPWVQPEPFPPTPVGARIGVTLVAVALCEATLRIGLPGVTPPEALMASGRAEFELLSLGALGVAPLLTAFLLVEVVAALLPAGRRMRAGGAAGRAHLDFLSVALTLVLAALQAGVFVSDVAALTPTSVPLAMASLLGVTALYLLLARWVTQRGLGEGLAVLLAWHVGRDYWAFWEYPELALVLGVGALATVWVRRLQSPVSLPTAGLLPVYAVEQAIAVIGLIGGLGVSAAQELLPDLDVPGHERDTLSPMLLGAAVMALLLDRVFAPDVDLARREGSPASLRRTTSATALAYALALVGASQLLTPGYTLHWVVDGALVTAVALDLVDAVRHHLAAQGRVAAWTFSRPLEVPETLENLAAAGIPAHVSGLHLATLLQFFGPFTRPRLWVAPGDVARARAWISGAPREPGRDVD